MSERICKQKDNSIFNILKNVKKKRLVAQAMHSLQMTTNGI